MGKISNRIYDVIRLDTGRNTISTTGETYYAESDEICIRIRMEDQECQIAAATGTVS